MSNKCKHLLLVLVLLVMPLLLAGCTKEDVCQEVLKRFKEKKENG